MMTGEMSELKGCSDVSENRESSNNSASGKKDALDLARNIREDAEHEERPCSINSPSVVTKERRSSLGSFASSGSDTPELDVEGSLAYNASHNHRKGSIKRTKRYLPPDEPDEVTDKVLIDVISPESPGLFRNILLTAAVSQAEKERRLSKDNSEVPESPILDDLCSSTSEIENEDSDKGSNEDSADISENTEKNTVENNRELSSSRKERDDKSAKSETCLLDGGNQRMDSFLKRPKSAPVEVASICTQTEWSWLEDMKIFEKLWPQRHSSIRPRDNADHPRGQIRRLSSQSIGYAAKGRNDENALYENEDSKDELYKEPTIEFNSSSSDEDDEMVELDKESFLPSIGPPKILQYVKESVNPPFQNEFPDKNNVDTEESILVDHSCAFCKTETAEISEESSEQISLSEKHCTCPVYEEHMKQQTTHKEDEGFIKDELIDIRPHPPFGTKAARKAAKERAAERAREREIDRQKVSGNAVNFYAMTRQMKTLTYSLASTKCMDDGWTVKPLAPMETEGGKHLEPFEIEINSSRTQQKETFFERFYTSGKRLLVLFPDGTGCCYYPSGNPAVIISSTEKGKYSYILQEDTSEHSRHHTGILGAFQPTGYGACYFQQTGNIRMVLTPFGGTYFDNKGERKKKWQWYNYSDHVHAPPFQPITFAMTKELSVRCMGQDYIIITYNHGRHTIRFNVGARIKIVTKKAKHQSSEEDYELHLKEIKQLVNMLIERVQMTLRFPRSTRINKLAIPKPERKHASRLESRIIDVDDSSTVVVN